MANTTLKEFLDPNREIRHPKTGKQIGRVMDLARACGAYRHGQFDQSAYHSHVAPFTCPSIPEHIKKPEAIRIFSLATLAERWLYREVIGGFQSEKSLREVTESCIWNSPPEAHNGIRHGEVLTEEQRELGRVLRLARKLEKKERKEARTDI
jgi:hypothetical protein